MKNKEEILLKRARKRNLTPMENMTIPEIESHIESLTLNQLRGLYRAMESCTKTNCGWVSYRIAEFYSSRVCYKIYAKEQIKFEKSQKQIKI